MINHLQEIHYEERQYARLLGYKKGADGLPEIVPEEAEIVRKIFRRYLDGASMEQIADGLNEKGLTTKGSIKKSVWTTDFSAAPQRIDKILERLENEDFALTDYDDVVVRQLIEKVTVIDKNTIAVTFASSCSVWSCFRIPITLSGILSGRTERFVLVVSV